jgi:hypothetical protein
VLAICGEIGVWAEAGFEVGSRWPLGRPSIDRPVLDTGRPATISDYSPLPGTIAAMVRAAPNPSWVGVPASVEGKTWGVVYACTSGITTADLPDGIESQLARSTDLVATGRVRSRPAAGRGLIAGRRGFRDRPCMRIRWFMSEPCPCVGKGSPCAAQR